jgi:hypothetical protein
LSSVKQICPYAAIAAKYGSPYEAPSLRGGEVWAGLDSNQRRRKASRFTVCPVWPLRYLPVMGLAVRLFAITHPAQQRRQRISRAVYIGLHLAVCKQFLGLCSYPRSELNDGPKMSAKRCLLPRAASCRQLEHCRMAERLPSKRWALRRRALTLPLRTVQPVETSMDLAPKNHSQPRGRGVQFQIGAVLQHSITPRGRIRGRGRERSASRGIVINRPSHSEPRPTSFGSCRI